MTSTQYMYGQGSEFEFQRLVRQGAMFESMTRETFTRAGLSRGMRVLDIGCGVGEVARIASDLVGNGRIVALDVDAKALEFAQRRLAGRNIDFVHSAVEDYKSAQPFDAAIGRFILMHVKDPLAA